MKNNMMIVWMAIGLVLVGVLAPMRLEAKPEHIEFESQKAKVRKEQATDKLKTIHLSRISDPEARKAIREILNYLNLPAQQN